MVLQVDEEDVEGPSIILRCRASHLAVEAEDRDGPCTGSVKSPDCTMFVLLVATGDRVAGPKAARQRGRPPRAASASSEWTRSRVQPTAGWASSATRRPAERLPRSAGLREEAIDAELHRASDD